MKRAEIERLLPEVVRRTLHEGAAPEEGGLLAALLEVMEALHAPTETLLDELEQIFDPYLAPEGMVPFLARWVDLDRLLRDAGHDPTATPAGAGRLRELVANAAQLAAWRGTATGLRAFLELATGVRGFVLVEGVDAHGQPKPFSLQVRAPAELTPLRALLERIIAMEKPVHVEAHLHFGDSGRG